MEYYITIVNKDKKQDPLVLHFAERDSIKLKWIGSDSKYQSVIGSSLDFSLLVKTCNILAYEDYFTNKEDQYIVSLHLANNNALIWRGYLLPETYKEPYHDETFFVYFTATDGLGLLKGKDLSDNFYKLENTVIDIFKEILSLTKLDFNLYFSPAIINSHKDWDKIYINGIHFEGKNAYQILEELLVSMRCQLFQADGRWYIEGVNRRQMLKNSYYIFGEGVSAGSTERIKNIKQVKWIETPDMTLIPSVNKVVSIHDKIKNSIPENAYQAENKDLSVNPHSRVNQRFLTDAWQHWSDYYPMFYTGKPNLYIRNDENASASSFFYLRKPIYVEKGESYNFKLRTSILLRDDEIQPDNNMIRGWMNKLVYYIYISGDVVATNKDRLSSNTHSLIFDDKLNAEVDFVFYAHKSGYLSIQIYNPRITLSPSPWNPTQIFDDRVHGFWLDELRIDLIGDLKGEEFENIVDQESTIINELKIPISQDLSALTPNFQLEKLEDPQPVSYGIKSFDVLKQFIQDGQKYYAISLEAASAADIKQNKVFLFSQNTGQIEITDYEVIYNFEGGNLFVIKDNHNYNIQNVSQIRVDFRMISHLNWPYLHEWKEWSDAIYPVQRLDYLQTVAEVEGNLYEKPYLQIEGEVRNPIKINDIILFPFRGKLKFFTVLDCEWNLGRGFSQILVQEAMYKGRNIGEYPPYVYAGDDIILEDVNQATPNPVAYSPDGNIETYHWDEVTSFGATILNANELIPTFQNLIFGNDYEFKLTVTDNYGNIASDIIKIEWQYKVGFIPTLTFERNDPPPINNPAVIFRKWTISQNEMPNFKPEYAYNLYIRCQLFYDGFGQMTSEVKILKNNEEEIGTFIIEREPWMVGQDVTRGEESFDVVLTMFPNDTFNIECYTGWTHIGISTPYTEVQAKVTLLRIEEINGNIESVNLPLVLESFIGYGQTR